MICDEDILSEVEVIIYTILTFFFFCVKWYENCITFLSCQQKKYTYVFNWLLLLILDFTVCYHI